MRRIDKVVDAPDAGEVFRSIEDPEHGPVLVTGLPFKSNLGAAATMRPAPVLGQHTHEVLADWLSFSDHEIRNLEEQGVLV